MRLKIDFAMTGAEFEALCMEKTKQRLYLFRHDMARGRKRFFSGELMGMYGELEISFARLYEKMGKETVPVKKLQRFRAEYLKGVREIWAEHYHNLSRFVLPFAAHKMAVDKVHSVRESIWDINHAFKLFKRCQKARISKADEAILPLLTAAMEQNFSLFYSIYKGNGCSWVNMDRGGPYGHSFFTLIKKVIPA